MIAVDVARFLISTLRETDSARVPAVAEQRADGVLARLEQRSHVVRLILRARVIVGELGREHVIADALAVDVNS